MAAVSRPRAGPTVTGLGRRAQEIAECWTTVYPESTAVMRPDYLHQTSGAASCPGVDR